MSEDKVIRITCEGAATLPLAEFEHFQGELKWLEEKMYAKLKASILSDGFHDPIHIWRKDGESKPRKMLDGHQRIRALRQMTEKEGYTIEGGELPVVWVIAEDERQAKRIVLEKMSEYGRYDEDSIYKFIHEADLDFPELKLAIDFPRLNMGKLEVGWFTDKTQTSGGEDKIASVFNVLIDCENEQEQLEVLARLEKDGYKCRALVS